MKSISSRFFKVTPWILFVLCVLGWVLNANWRSLFPVHDNILANIVKESNELRIPEEMLKLGVLLALKGQYNEADQILRYIINQPFYDEWFNSIIAAQAILRSDSFYSYYLYGPPVSNTFFVTNLPINALYDKESVRRKYGIPDDVEIYGDSHETWLYSGDQQCGQMQFFFYGNVLHGFMSEKCGGMTKCSSAPKNPLSFLNLPIYTATDTTTQNYNSPGNSVSGRTTESGVKTPENDAGK